jgi:signal peptidase I
MEPTLIIGDLVLAQKRGFAHAIGRRGLAKGQLVLFTPPLELRRRVEAAGGRVGDRDMFVKRVAAVAGDEVSVDALGVVAVNGVAVNGVGVNGLPASAAAGQLGMGRVRGGKAVTLFPVDSVAAACDAPNEVVRKRLVVLSTTTIKEGSIYVLGDCSGASVDSRVWGPLDELNVVGTPTARLWPPSRFGGVR